MTGDTAASIAWGIGALALVGSSLVARRLPLGPALRMALAWIAIFGVVFVLFLFRDEGRALWERATAELGGADGVVHGRTLSIPRGPDGHFHVTGAINGVRIGFLIDSGASVTTLSRDAAMAARVTVSEGFPVAIETANGATTARRAAAAALIVGPITQADPPLLVQDGLGGTNLLGMSFLDGLKSWRVEGERLVLEPR